jgi:hypothetical protein
MAPDSLLPIAGALQLDQPNPAVKLCSHQGSKKMLSHRGAIKNHKIETGNVAGIVFAVNSKHIAKHHCDQI